MPAAAESEIRVRFIECDPAGILHFAHYANFADIGKSDFFRKYQGRPRKPGDDGAITVLVQTSFEYKGVARFDDVIVIRTTLAFVKNSSFGFDYEFINKETGALLCTAKATFVSLSQETKKPTAVPALLRSLTESAASV